MQRRNVIRIVLCVFREDKQCGQALIEVSAIPVIDPGTGGRLTVERSQIVDIDPDAEWIIDKMLLLSKQGIKDPVGFGRSRPVHEGFRASLAVGG